jgi:hypothetical protein
MRNVLKLLCSHENKEAESRIITVLGQLGKKLVRPHLDTAAMHGGTNL